MYLMHHNFSQSKFVEALLELVCIYMFTAICKALLFQYDKGPPCWLFNRLDLFSVSSIGVVIDL